MRLWATSEGLDPAGLVPGEDLVLDLDPLHGDTAPGGVYALDHLGVGERERVDRLARELLGAWCERAGDRLTRESIPWGWVWELELHNLLGPAIAQALGLQRALDAYGAEVVEPCDDDPRTLAMAEAVAALRGTAVEPPAAGRRRPGAASRRPGRRRAALDGVLAGLGFPTRLRPGAIIFIPYWPLSPVLDRMFAEPGWRPAIWLGKRPARPMRTVRALLRGGWVGLPTRLDRSRSQAPAAGLVEAISAPEPLVADGIDLGPVVLPLFGRLAEGRARGDLALARQWDRALAARRASRLVCANDIEPLPRILVLLARRHGLPTLAVQHGAFLIPQPVSDLDAVDEVALWSQALAPPMTNLDRPVHEVGYPLPHAPTAYPSRLAKPDSPTALVLGQVGDASTATIDKRLTVRSYQAAAEAFLKAFPRGTVVLRPHPSEGSGPPALVAERFGDRVRVDRSPDLAGVMAGADLCIGGTSAATLQAAVEGLPTIVLNLSGFAWPWPLGGDTQAPVACSEAELEAQLEGLRRNGPVAGQADLLKGLGAEGGDAAGRVLELLRGPEAGAVS